MNCRDAQQALIEALYGELPAPVRRDVEAHRTRCADCTETWRSLQVMHRALDQWHDVSPPADLQARILARVATERRAAATEVWGHRGLASTGLSVGVGLAMTVLTVLLLLRWLPLEAVPPQALLICGALWGGAYIGLFRLALSEAAWSKRRWFPGRFQVAGAAGLAIVAVGIATLLVPLLAAFPLTSWLGTMGSSPWVTVVGGGGGIALVALLISSWGLGPLLGPQAMLQALLAACLFLLAVAPGLLMFCIPFTLGVYAGALLTIGLGASAGGALGMWLRLYNPFYARS